MLQRELAKAPLRFDQPGHRARNTDRQIANCGSIGNDLALAVEIHIGGRTQGRFFTEVDEVRFTVGQAQHHEAASAQVACVGVDDSQCEANGDRGIHCVASCLQHLQTCITGVVMNADHHGVLRLGWRNIATLRLARCQRGQQRKRAVSRKEVRAWPTFLRSLRRRISFFYNGQDRDLKISSRAASISWGRTVWGRPG